MTLFMNSVPSEHRYQAVIQNAARGSHASAGGRAPRSSRWLSEDGSGARGAEGGGAERAGISNVG